MTRFPFRLPRYSIGVVTLLAFFVSALVLDLMARPFGYLTLAIALGLFLIGDHARKIRKYGNSAFTPPFLPR